MLEEENIEYEKSVLIGIINQQQDEEKSKEYLDELEFLIRLIGSSNFKGNDLMFIYDLVNKLQNLYLDKKGVK